MAKTKINRDKITKAATLEIESDSAWVLYAGQLIRDIDYDHPLLEGEGSGVFELDIPADRRSYFDLRVNNKRHLFSENKLPMEGAYNFRDLGGIKTTEGKSVKWGKFFRSDDLMNLTDADLEYLAELSILSIIDFRTEEEVKVSPDRLHALLNTYWLPISTASLSKEAIVRASASLSLDKLMKDSYIDLVSSKECMDCYRKFFAVITDTKKIPVIYHCSAGKDRTGMASALLLAALGVEENLIVENYLESNANLKDKYNSVIEKYPQLEPMFSVKADYLTSAFEYLKTEYGSVEKYLKQALGVNVAKLRKSYLFHD